MSWLAHILIMTWPQGYKTFFIFKLDSTEHEISTARKTKIQTNEEVYCLSLSDDVFIMLINIKMPTIVIYHANKC